MPKDILELHDKMWLVAAYEEKNTHEIAKELGCSQWRVWNALKRHGIPLRAPGRPEGPEVLKNKEWLQDQYETYTTHEIAALLGCNKTTILDAMIQHGIPLRRQIRRRRTHNPPQMLHPETGKITRVHRYLMEQHLERKLQTNEHVHHIDGNPENNDLSNLIVLTESEHHRLHGRDGKKRMERYNYLRFLHVCKTCNRHFYGGNRAQSCPECKRKPSRK